MESSIRLGVIGPRWIRAVIDPCLQMFPSIQPIFRLSDELEEAIVFTEELEHEVDAYIYSGQVPYMLAKFKIPPGIPAFYIPLKGTGLYQALYKLRMNAPFTHISFDGIISAYVDRVKVVLNENFSYSICDQKPLLENVAEMVRFHEGHFKTSENSVAITCMKLVSERLTERGIPNEWLRPTEEDITVTLERLLLATTQRRQRESQIVFGRIQIDSYSKLVKQLASEHQVQKRNVQLYRLLLDYVEQLDGYLTSVSEDEYLFITNRGIFEQVTEGYKRMPIVEDVKLRLNLRVSIGVGFGRSATEAGTHSRMALFQAQDYGGSACFIVKEDRSVFGPVEWEAPIVYPLTVTDQKILGRAEKTGMNAAYLEKMIAIVRRKKRNEFTAYELAQIVGITTRSAHRIILSWQDAELIKVVGTEKMSTRGRPRQVYQFDFNVEEGEEN
ncbi:hypothetical protein [Bacillus sp. FSL K6-3431]|uniref:hypothetical protein n=1 Tax=Bacillus sp. FSL K6-3431 TaxID=2921500 RepID=UPI0030FC2956